jgi:hypothetical protein
MEVDFVLGDYREINGEFCQARLLVTRGMLDPIGLCQVKWFTREATGSYGELQQVGWAAPSNPGRHPSMRLCAPVLATRARNPRRPSLLSLYYLCIPDP